MSEILLTALHSVKTVAIGLLVLGILVLIHELGHFIIAKLCGIRVLAFSVGFGRPLVSWTVNGTNYRICAIPFGGYVQMAAEHPEDGRTGASDEFPQKPIWQRALVALGGPAANYLSSILFLWFILLGGIDQPLYLERPIVGAAADTTIAFRAGVRAGDSIVTVNNRPVTSWNDIQKLFSLQDPVYTLGIARNSTRITAAINIPRVKGNRLPDDPMAGLRPPAPAVVGSVIGQSPALKAGFARGDSVVSINGRTVHSWFELTQITSGYDSSTGVLQFVLMRADSLITLDVKPRFEAMERRYVIGIGAAPAPSRRVKLTPAEAVSKATAQSGEFVVLTFLGIKKLVTGEVSPQQLLGPVGIVQASGSIAQAEGLRSILNLMAFIGVNLAILNLMPLVITDGGLLLFLLIEAVRRRPLSLKAQSIVNRVAWAFFLTLFVFVTFNDILRIPTLFRMFGR